MLRTVQGRLFAGTGAVVLGFALLSFASIELMMRRHTDAAMLRELDAARLASGRVLALRREVLQGGARALAQTPYLKATYTIDELDAATAFATAVQLKDVSETPLLLLLDAQGLLLADAADPKAPRADLSAQTFVQQTLDRGEGQALWFYRGRSYLASACAVTVGDGVVGVVVIGIAADDAFAAEIRQITGADVLFVRGGRLIGQARSAAADASERSGTALAAALESARAGHGSRDVFLLSSSAEERAAAVDLEDGVTLVLVRTLTDMLRLQEEQKRGLLLVSLICALLAIAASRMMAARLCRPIVALTRASEMFGHGDLTVSVPEGGGDELGALSAGFNRMTGRIARLVAEVRSHADVLEAQQRQLQQAHSAAESANRAKSAFLANMSHELRTPLTAIIGYSEMLIEEAEEREELADAADLEKIVTSARHLLSLVNDVLDISKVEAGKVSLEVEPFNLDALLSETIGLVQPLAAKNRNRLLLVQDKAVGTIVGDSQKVRQVINNLLSNACKFTRDGDVTLRARRHVVDGWECMAISVSDTGIGIADDGIDGIFEPFSQADNSTARRYGGTGLGLAISRSYCELMGGTITVTSVVGRGSTFTATVRADLRPASALAAASAA